MDTPPVSGILLLLALLFTARCFLEEPQQPQATTPAQTPAAAAAGSSASGSTGQVVAPPTTVLTAPTYRSASAVVAGGDSGSRAGLYHPTLRHGRVRFNAGLTVRLLESRAETDDAQVTGTSQERSRTTAPAPPGTSPSPSSSEPDGAVLRNAVATLDNLPSGRTWHFRTPIHSMRRRTQYYEMAGIFAALIDGEQRR